MTSPDPRSALLFSSLLLAVGLGAPTVQAEEPAAGFSAGDVLVRARIMGTIPANERSRIDLIGGRVETPGAVLPDADVTWFMTDNLALSGQGGVVESKPEIVDSLVGDIPIGSIWNAAGSASLQYHFFPDADFKPYLGAGASVVVPYDIEPAGGLVQDFEVDTMVGLLFQAGFDYRLTGNWYGNAEAKAILMPTYELTSAGITAAVKQDTVVFATGIGYRF